MKPLTFSCRSTFKRLFLHKNKDKKSSLEGVEETENTAPGLTVLETATTKKNLEASSHQHRHPAGEKHAKEPGGKGKKNRNLKIGKITVSEKWRESVFRKITNANELKYLDEFLLNKINDLRSQKTPIESLFIEATEKFRSNLKTMYSVPNGKIHVGYKDLMENYQIVVNNLAAERGEKDTNLVLNLFQSLLDEFTRGHTKNDFEPPKQSKAQKKKRKQDRAVSICACACGSVFSRPALGSPAREREPRPIQAGQPRGESAGGSALAAQRPPPRPPRSSSTMGTCSSATR